MIIDIEKLGIQSIDVLVSQTDILQLVRVMCHVVRAASLKMQQRRHGLVGPHERRIARVCVWSGLRRRRLKVIIVLFRGVALGFGLRHAATEAVDFLLHLGVLRSLSDTLEVGLDLAVQLQAPAARAALERFLHNIASQLQTTMWSAI